MDLRNKIKKIVSDIKEHTGRTPEEETPPSDFNFNPRISRFQEQPLEIVNDPQADKEAIESIGKDYYNDEKFDITLYELKKLPDKLDLADIAHNRDKLEKQKKAVSKKVTELVLEKHPQYNEELENVMELQRNLKKTSEVCTLGRSKLSTARTEFTTASLGLCANYKKRQQLYLLLKTLRTIRTLQQTDIRLREMLEEEDYPGAIQLCLECQKAASTFRHYRCISELSSKLQDTLLMIEEALDVALAKTCDKFNEKHYEKVQAAYRLLGKTEIAMDQLHMHFTSAIHIKAFTIVHGYVTLCAGTTESNFQKRPYSDLCKNISKEVFTECLINLCKALWEVMNAYHKTVAWHKKYEQETMNEPDGGGNTVAANFNRRFIKQKLDHCRGRIWDDVQQKVKVYALATDLSGYDYDHFITVLDIINRLIQIGEEFCNSRSDALQASIRTQSSNYFLNYHRQCMDKVRMYFENEGWQLCPVSSSFSILQLHEFKFLRQAEAACVQTSPEANGVKCISYGYFDKYQVVGSPFDITIDVERIEDVFVSNGYDDDQSGFPPEDSDSELENDELTQDKVDEGTGEETRPRKISKAARRHSASKMGRPAPIIINTTLEVCRLFGQYMQMMNVLQPIAYDVINCMSQLFDYYLYTIYTYFASTTNTYMPQDPTLSEKLRQTLRRIKDSLILDETQVAQAEERNKYLQPRIPHLPDMNSPEKLYGLAERVAATESLVFLAGQMEYLQSHLETNIPASKKGFLQHFYSQTVLIAPELRQSVYRRVAEQVIDYDNLLQQMAAVKWDPNDILSQHSSYVDVLLHELESFSNRLDVIGATVPISKTVEHTLWKHIIYLINRVVVEGYASAKRCTGGGRALMQLNFQQFLVKLGKLTDLKPIPDQEYVEKYVKAYYQQEAHLETWIREHREYSKSQVISLIHVMATAGHINKKGKQRLLQLVEETRR